MSRGEYGIAVAGFGDQLKTAKLTEEFEAVHRKLFEQSRARPEWTGWFTAAVEPVYQMWNTFRQSAGDTIDSVTYKSWSDKLALIRAGAKSLGMKPPMDIGTIGLIGGGAVLGLVAVVVVVRKVAS